MSNTFLPGNSSIIPGNKHARGYVQQEEGSELKDVTHFNPSIASSAGDMISTADDLNKFFSYLLGGKLLKRTATKTNAHYGPYRKGRNQWIWSRNL